MSDFAVSFANLLRARFPYIYVGTWEEERVLGMIRETARNADLVRTPRTVFTWSVTDGLVGPSAPAKETCQAPLDALGFVARHTEPAVFVFKDFHVFFGSEKREQDHTRWCASCATCRRCSRTARSRRTWCSSRRR